MGSTIRFQLGGLLLLLKAEIWVTNDLGKSSFLDTTVWVVWRGEDVEQGRGNQEQLEIYVAEESRVHQRGQGRKAAVQTPGHQTLVSCCLGRRQQLKGWHCQLCLPPEPTC